MTNFIIGIILTGVVSCLCVKGQFMLAERQIKKEKNHRNFASAKECLAYFNVEVPKGMVIFHTNGHKEDNRFTNLEIITRKEMLGRIHRGSK